VVYLAAGFLAEVASGVFWTPMEVIKQRLQVTVLQESKVSAFALAKDALRAEGLYGLYRGYLVTLAVFVPYTMAYFASYEWLKLWQMELLNVRTSKELPFWSYVVGSGVAGESLR